MKVSSLCSLIDLLLVPLAGKKPTDGNGSLFTALFILKRLYMQLKIKITFYEYACTRLDIKL